MSPLSLAVPVRCLGFLFMAQCLVQQWVHAMRQLLVFLEVFVVKVNSFPEVDSRLALLGFAVWSSAHSFCFGLLGLLPPRNLDIISTSLANVAAIAHCFSFVSEEFFLCQTQEGRRGRREFLTLR